MNRVQRRKQQKQENKKLYSLSDVQRSLLIAVEMKKISKGHLFSKTLKNRCVFCGVTSRTKKQCDYWVMTMFDRMQSVLINPSFFTDDNLQCLWLQHGEEYQNIKLPMNVTPSEKKTSSIPVKVDPSLYSAAAGYTLSKKDKKAKDEADGKKQYET